MHLGIPAPWHLLNAGNPQGSILRSRDMLALFHPFGGFISFIRRIHFMQRNESFSRLVGPQRTIKKLFWDWDPGQTRCPKNDRILVISTCPSSKLAGFTGGRYTTVFPKSRDRSPGAFGLASVGVKPAALGKGVNCPFSCVLLASSCIPVRSLAEHKEQQH